MKETTAVQNGKVESGPVVKVKEEQAKKRKCCMGGPLVWCRKYFWEGQELSDSHARKVDSAADQNLPCHKRFLLHHRRLIGPLIPAVIINAFWWALFINHNLWHLFEEKYFMSITMIFGSFIAGMTSEGGGAVAFPVMTLGFGIQPSVARDFSVMIQSVGMSAASFAIVFMKVKVEWHSVILCTFGGVLGLVTGIHQVDPYLTGPQKKIGFVSVWAAFASVLVFLNRNHKRHVYDSIQKFNMWKGLVLIITGFVGGLCTSFAGSGLDICSFSILTLLFRVSEKVATPTSVILMAVNSVVGFYWRAAMMRDISVDAWEFLGVCAPIVVVGAPMGAFCGSHFHRLVLAAAVVIIDAVALIGAYVIVPMSPVLIGASVGIIVGGFIFFGLISLCGHKMMLYLQKKEEDSEGSGDVNEVSLRAEIIRVDDTGLSRIDWRLLSAPSSDKGGSTKTSFPANISVSWNTNENNEIHKF